MIKTIQACEAIKEKSTNGCHLKNIGQIALIFQMHFLAAYVHEQVKYGVSTIEDRPQTTPDARRRKTMTHDGQFMIIDQTKW